MLVIPLVSEAQYFQYSQYNFTNQRINPATVASSDYASADLIYRNQNTGGDIHLKSSMASGVYPFLNRKNGRRWSGMGISLMDDRSGGIFTMQEASFSYAVNVFFNRFQSLALGFRGLYLQRRVDLNGLVTGSQYIHDRGFDGSLFNGENFGLLRSAFMTFSTGLHWQQNDRKGTRIAYWGLSLFDMNKPEDSFSGVGSQLRSTWVAQGGVRIYEQDNISITPEFLLTHSASNNMLNVGAITSYTLKPFPNQITGRVDLITKYVPGRSGILGLQFHKDNFSLGFSYDFPVVKKNPGNTGAFEIALQVRRLVDAQLRNKVARKNRSAIPSKTTAREPQPKKVAENKGLIPKPVSKNDSVTINNHPKQDLGTVLRLKRDSVIANAKAGRVSHEPFLIEKLVLHFNFEFNSTALDEASVKYLDDLSTALKEDVHMKIRLTGHTDNVGSAAFNMRLSLFRANSVREYLLERGVDASRIETQGKGLTEPLNEKKTEAERSLNRRVELIIYYQE